MVNESMTVDGEDFLISTQSLWDKAAQEDAMHSICTNRTDWSESDFFDTGKAEIADLMHTISASEYEVYWRDALDFGCGIGRCTQALARYFKTVVGCDMSRYMVMKAQDHNVNPRVQYVHSGANLLNSFKPGEFSFVFSTLTLQHMPQWIQANYIRQIVELLEPNGLAALTIPHGRSYPHAQKHLSMYGTAPDQVTQWVIETGSKVIGVQLHEISGPWCQLRYFIRKG